MSIHHTILSHRLLSVTAPSIKSSTIDPGGKGLGGEGYPDARNSGLMAHRKLMRTYITVTCSPFLNLYNSLHDRRSSRSSICPHRSTCLLVVRLLSIHHTASSHPLLSMTFPAIKLRNSNPKQSRKWREDRQSRAGKPPMVPKKGEWRRLSGCTLLFSVHFLAFPNYLQYNHCLFTIRQVTIGCCL